MGNASAGTACADGPSCRRAAAAAGCTGDGALLSLGRERGLPGVRTLLEDVYAARLGVWGGTRSF